MILLKLKETTSSIAKEHILQSASEIDKLMFKYAYDIHKTYFLKFSVIDWDSIKEPQYCMFSLLDKLLNREITGNQAREEVMTYAEANGDLIKLICNKDLDCGASRTTLNKVFGKNFIPSFNVQRAVKVPIEKINTPILGQLKYNGARVIIIIQNREVLFKSRGGHIFEFPYLKEVIANTTFWFNNIVIEGELGYGDTKNSNHTKVSGLVNSAIRGTPIRDKNLVFTCFDGMTLDQFVQNDCPDEYFTRYSNIGRFVSDCNHPSVKLADTFEFYSQDQIREKFDSLIEEGYEGLILKHHNSKYTFKKNKEWIKLKAEDPADLLCVGITDGKDNFEGGIGSLICEGTVEGKKVQVNVSSGLKFEERFVDPNKYIGKTIQVRYNEVIKDKSTGLYSLFIPVFEYVREDKT